LNHQAALAELDAVALAVKIRQRQVTASEVAAATLDRIRDVNPRINAFTTVTAEQALDDARRVDSLIAAGKDPGSLAGVPFAVKNLFDIAGVTTIAGSTIRRSNAPAAIDATIVRRLRAAGAILVGATNMDEFAYGFTTDNTHYGPTRNPHDPARTAGGSSGGSTAAVAAGLVRLALGTDTGGSIRVPASLCGVFGLKPSFGRLTRTGTVLFVPSIDHVGPFARSVRDLSLAYDLMQGADPTDPSCASLPPAPSYDRLSSGVETLRIAVAGGYFRQQTTAEAREAVDRVVACLGVEREIDLPRPDLARAAAYVIGAAEGAGLHLDDMRRHLDEFDPNTRGLFLAGALLPAAWYVKAQRFRRWLNDEIARVFSEVDIILAAATPCTATLLGQETVEIGGKLVPARPSLGLLTQPFSATGVAVVTVPLKATNGLPIGVQVIAAPYQEEAALRVAYALERGGVAVAQVRSDPAVSA
jgi:AtzE family amidohydrolase